MINNNDGKNIQRYDTKTNWEKFNPVLEKGELVFEDNEGTIKQKVGDGVTSYTNLPYNGLQPSDIKIEQDIPIGFEYFSICPSTRSGSLPLVGNVYQRELYPLLWEWVQKQGGYLITEKQWQEKSKANNGNVPFYSSGDGSTTFRVPSLKCYVKSANNEIIDTYIEAGLPDLNTEFVFRQDSINANNKHLSDNWKEYGNNGFTGSAWSNTGSTDEYMLSNNKFTKALTPYDIRFNNPLYGKSETVQVESIIGMWYVKAYTGVITDTRTNLYDLKEILKGIEIQKNETRYVGAMRTIFNVNEKESGELIANGGLYQRELYKHLFDYAVSKDLVLQESEWKARYLENNTFVPYYSYGTNDTNFRVPLINSQGDYVVEEVHNGNSWYRLYLSGWIEQGGSFEAYASYTTKTIEFIKSFKDTTYHIEFTQGYTSNLYAPVLKEKHTDTATFVNTYNTAGLADWYACGYTTEKYKPKDIYVIKAIGKIDTTGSTTTDTIAKNINDLNTKMDSYIENALNTHATTIAEMQSFFNNTMEEVELFNVIGNSAKWTGNIEFKENWENFDFLVIEFATSYPVNAEYVFTRYLSTKEIKKNIEAIKNANLTYYALPIDISISSWYWRMNVQTSSSLSWVRYNHSSVYPRRVWGYRLKATGLTNKYAIDVSEISKKIGSMITADNHLILPSGLEIW